MQCNDATNAKLAEDEARRATYVNRVNHRVEGNAMIVSGSIVAAAKWYGVKELAASAGPGEQLTRADDVVDLLANATSPRAQPLARELLREMGSGPWKVIRGAHSSTSDPTPHVLVEVSGHRYHLRLDGQGCVFDITKGGNESDQRGGWPAPWVGPGV
jgi:hypothetical protein